MADSEAARQISGPCLSMPIRFRNAPACEGNLKYIGRRMENMKFLTALNIDSTSILCCRGEFCNFSSHSCYGLCELTKRGVTTQSVWSTSFLVCGCCSNMSFRPAPGCHQARCVSMALKNTHTKKADGSTRTKAGATLSQ